MLNTRLRFLLSVIFFVRAREGVLVTVKKMRGFAALHDARCAVARKAGGFKEFAGAAVSGGQPDLADLKAADVEDGEGVGHFRNGPYDLNDVRIDDASLLSRKEEIIAAVQTVNFGALPQRFMGEKP